jgi:hypothetical protein
VTNLKRRPQQISRWTGGALIRTDAKTAAFTLIEDKERTKYEAKEYDLPLVRQGCA